jgi:hypothetical protein
LLILRLLPKAVCCAAMMWAAPALVCAQTFETIGIRAQGMGGAFVAIADDASATWWNPAGLASGALLSGIVERGMADAPSDDTTVGVSFVVPSLGLSYYRLRTSVRTAAGFVGSPGGEPPALGAAGLSLPTFVFHQVGASFGQSIGNHVVVASTLRLVSADQIRGDVDLGAMLRFGVTRVGVVVKHIHEPEVTADRYLLAFDRQVRVGVAYVPHPGTLTVNVAFDADLTTTPTVFGDVRHLAAGAELWIHRRVAVRGGGSVNTVDQRRPSFSAGASAALQKAWFVDAQLTGGDDAVKHGWGLALRVTF